MTMSHDPRDADQIDFLEHELSELACRFRSDPEVQESVIEQYAVCLQKLYQFPQWSGEPDADCQLPDKYMPDVYLRFWDQRIGTFESIIRSELKRASNVQPKQSIESFLSELGPVISDARLKLAHPRTLKDRISAVCEVIGPIAIVLDLELQGDGVSRLIWRVCKRLLWSERIDVSDQGQREFIERLRIPGIVDEDLSVALARYCRTIKDVDQDSRASRLVHAPHAK